MSRPDIQALKALIDATMVPTLDMPLMEAHRAAFLAAPRLLEVYEKAEAFAKALDAYEVEDDGMTWASVLPSIAALRALFDPPSPAKKEPT